VEARKRYPGRNIDVVNISADGSFSWWELLIMPGLPGLVFGVGGIALDDYGDMALVYTSFGIFGGGAIAGNFQKITATGYVVAMDQMGPQTIIRPNAAAAASIEKAVAGVSADLINDLPAKATVAVINISSDNREMSALAAEELEFQLVSAKKFTIVDRKTLNAIRTEQNFQLSGEVSDSSAVTIGQMLGANIVISGSITGTGTSQRLTIKALDVKTAQIVTMARESF
jgi:TolB-like protein